MPVTIFTFTLWIRFRAPYFKYTNLINKMSTRLTAGFFVFMKRIAIQGYQGSFHHEAAVLYFGNEIEIVECATFRDAFKAAGNLKLSDGGLIAIENSIAGSILPNYNLLQRSDLQITGEIYLKIRQNLLANPDTGLEQIREVHSHPMALLQCAEFLEKHKWKLVETDDTALSARNIMLHHSKHIAAIAGRFAAVLYGLKIIFPNIHTAKNNFTRFLVLEPAREIEITGAENKASLYFETEHKKGSLASVLTVVAEHNINLSKLQSFPIPGSDWKYYFHADMEFESISDFNNAINIIKQKTAALRVYGVYAKGETHK